MKLNFVVLIFYSGLNCATNLIAAEAVKDPLQMIVSENPGERSKGFYELIKPTMISGRITYTCEFTDADIGKTRKLLGELLRKEKVFDFDEYYFKKHGRRIAGRDLYTHRTDKAVANYLYAKEDWGVYLANLEDFMDSCEEESLVDLFPGPRTFNKYLEKSTEEAFKKIDEIKKSDDSVKRKNNGVLIFLGDAAIKNKNLQPQLYDRVKAKLIELSENDCLADRAISVMEKMGDLDFLPVLEKISKFDDSKGCVMVMDGQKTVLPVSRSAKRALKRLQTKKNGNMMPQ